jgi:branched-chain amino acid transport system permease protein
LISQATGLDPLLTLLIAAVVGFVLGMLCYWEFVRYLLRGPMVAQLLGTFGLMLVLRNLALLFFGSQDRMIQTGILVNRSVDFGIGVIVPATKVAAAGLSVVSFALLFLVMNRTRMGKALVATSLNPQAARYMGIATERMSALAWGIGVMTVTIAGALLANFWVVSPFVGLLFTMIAFAIVALGGFGSIPGAFFAGLIAGLIIEIPGFWDFISYTFNIHWMQNVPMISLKYTGVYLAYFIIMLVRPRGLFGWKQ